MELNPLSNDNIFFSSIQDDYMSVYPLEYIRWVAKQLNCKKGQELRLLLVHPDFQEHDEEGWRIESFFPAKTEINQEVIHSDMDENLQAIHLENFAIGEILKLQINGKTLIADYNVSPFSVWINEEDLW